MKNLKNVMLVLSVVFVLFSCNSEEETPISKVFVDSLDISTEFISNDTISVKNLVTVSTTVKDNYTGSVGIRFNAEANVYYSNGDVINVLPNEYFVIPNNEKSFTFIYELVYAELIEDGLTPFEISNRGISVWINAMDSDDPFSTGLNIGTAMLYE